MKLLIIEDDPNIVAILKNNFDSEGFVTDIADDGDAGSAMARVNQYDLIILDMNLPHKSGDAICKEIRGAGKNTPILVLTIDEHTDNKVALLNAGADDYITKPFSFHELLARVRAILRRPTQIADDTMRAHDVTMNISSQTVRVGSKEVYLTRKEFSLLECLMRNKGKMVSRGMIIDNAWDNDADFFSNAIETHILNIRKKIDSKDRYRLIKTVPGRGYKIE
ncbi:MAG: DNA-binding response regulator [Candidatus Magasanikbacteria bacterium CG10_big_fil_rev_8_21_14_0_10_47_10]|uniref:DNA-binding response regulator n=1 Tax=Candidatus Magasanikbacteria bacterium CG10_big_fil_rev_8_21_14_0_10_47_10 TaxID=1974652 RepID=A0A2H0TPL3_9BACT|nr:MAG: DNA-binding response regulator [Candidatus Magasanikbacteria bacterium CG10_big_fil_rev_8_21_14_0_10_47_10]